MKQIDNIQKKAYAQPKTRVVRLKSKYMLAASVPSYDDELGAKENSGLFDETPASGEDRTIFTD